MSINLVRRQYGGTPQHPILFGVEFSQSPDVIYWLESTTIPGRTIGNQSINWMYGVYHYVTRTTGAGTWNCTFYVFEDMAPMKWLYNWYEKSFNWRTGVFGKREDYSMDATVFLMDSTTQERTMQFTMYHIMLTSFGDITNLAFDNESPVKITASFAFEDFDVSFNTQDGLGS